jgi:ABC-type nitrate/sulfonate/bicarbonate transport system ATPase subunit
MTLIKLHNAETGEVIEREMDSEELAQWQSVQDKVMARLKAEADKAAAKAAAEAKLAAIGLTADDLKALGL